MKFETTHSRLNIMTGMKFFLRLKTKQSPWSISDHPTPFVLHPPTFLPSFLCVRVSFLSLFIKRANLHLCCRLDYVSSSNELDVFFHADFSHSGTGFEIAWRAVDVASCLSGRTILAGLGGNGFPIQDAMIHSPNFPHFNLPNLNCAYTIVAPGKESIPFHLN